MTDLIDRIEAATGADRRIINRLNRSADCWLWTGALDFRSRGRVWHNGKLKLHHRAVWEILRYPIPDGAFLCHHCDNPQCANPEHMYVGDAKTNVADMVSRKRHGSDIAPDVYKRTGVRLGSRNTWSRGEGNPKAKLTAAQCASIYQSGEANKILAERFGVHVTTIQRIKRGHSWSAAALKARESEG